MSAAFGMMDGTYFVPRGELLAWLNDLLDLDYTKVEQVCNGAAICQIFDALYPGTVPLNKLNFDSKLEYKWIENFKVLQLVLKKHNIDKDVDVAKLIKGKYQDNLEFLQWVKKFFDVNYKGDPYNAIERRKAAGVPYAADKSKPGHDYIGGPSPVAPVTPAKETPMKKSTSPAVKTPSPSGVKSPTKKATPAKTTPAKTSSSAAKNDDSKVQESQQLADLKMTIDTLERERDFYFGKLRDIEILAQNYEGEGLEIVSQIQKILYATDEQSAEEGQTEEPQVEETPAEETPAEEEAF